jgi:hypothetical protein
MLNTRMSSNKTRTNFRIKCRKTSLMESRGSIGQPKGHHQELEVATVCVECRLVDAVRVHVHLVIAAAEVKLGEEPRTAEFIHQLIDHRNWEFVLHRALV